MSRVDILFYDPPVPDPTKAFLFPNQYTYPFQPGRQHNFSNMAFPYMNTNLAQQKPLQSPQQPFPSTPTLSPNTMLIHHTDQAVFHKRQLKHFTDDYHLDPNTYALSLYTASPLTFVVFAVLCPRPAFLLERLQQHYRHLHASLTLFQSSNVSYGYPSNNRGNNCKNDLQRMVWETPFTYFNRDLVTYEQKNTLLQLRAALEDHGIKGLWVQNAEVARDVLDFVEDTERKAIVEELLTDKCAEEIAKVVPVQTDAGIWQVRLAVRQREAMLLANAKHLRNKLDKFEKMEMEKAKKERKRGAGGSGRDRESYVGRPRAKYDDGSDLGTVRMPRKYRYDSRSRSRSPYPDVRDLPTRKKYWHDSSPSSSTVDSIEFVDDDKVDNGDEESMCIPSRAASYETED